MSLLLFLLACGPTSQSSDSAPTANTGATPCTFEGSFALGLQGDLAVEEGHCRGAASSGYNRTHIQNERYEVTVALDTSLILQEGATFSDAQSHLVVLDKDSGESWRSQSVEPCVAQVTEVAPHLGFAGQELYVTGTLVCTLLYGPTVEEDAELKSGSFFMVFD